MNKPPLTLGTDPRSVHEARRWVAQTCRELGRDDLVECAELGVSELVTNALLHAGDPILVRMRGTMDHPRVEVADSSHEPPVLTPVDTDDPDDLLSTFGRGINIVARCSVAWGASIEPDGKVVWFEPAQVPHQNAAQPGALFDLDDLPLARHEPGLPTLVRLRSVPVATAVGLRRHYHDLRREVRLLSLAHEEDYPLARNLTDVFSRFDRAFPREATHVVEKASTEGNDALDFDVIVDAQQTGTFEQMLSLLDLADEFCRAQRLLSLERSPEQVAFQRWYLGEFIRQSQGEHPLPWSGSHPRTKSSQASAKIVS
ncbi:MAG: ATP-binding protein [Nocardioidaceae bacterium]